jgi:hypothetical protein
MFDPKSKKFVAAAAVVTTATVMSAPTPVHAQAVTGGGVADVTAMVTSLGAIGAAIATVVLGTMGIRMAIKLVNRAAVKG